MWHKPHHLCPPPRVSFALVSCLLASSSVVVVICFLFCQVKHVVPADYVDDTRLNSVYAFLADEWELGQVCYLGCKREPRRGRKKGSKKKLQSIEEGEAAAAGDEAVGEGGGEAVLLSLPGGGGGGGGGDTGVHEERSGSSKEVSSAVISADDVKVEAEAV